MSGAYEYRHVVSFEETNIVGNVYYVNHLSWQGRCRELFIREQAPCVLEELEKGLCLVTVQCSCEYIAELFVFEEIIVRMRLGDLARSRISLLFEYLRRNGETEELVARGEQQVACMRRVGSRLVPEPIPECLRDALRPYS